jgi:Mrp family chromosome partitioning ATPase
MLRRRARLPVLAQIAGPAADARAWSLSRDDFAGLEQVLPQLEGKRVLLVCGEAGEAAPVAALALAAAAVSSGRRAIVVECDLAHPCLAAQVGLAAAPGLQEYLRWEAEPPQVIQPVVLGGSAAAGAIEPLVCICGGRPATNVETLLGLQSFAHMVEKLRAAYELVVLSGPPAAAEPGSCAAVARQADAVVAGLPAASVSGRDGKTVRTAINRLPAPTLGAISVRS